MRLRYGGTGTVGEAHVPTVRLYTYLDAENGLRNDGQGKISSRLLRQKTPHEANHI